MRNFLTTSLSWQEVCCVGLMLTFVNTPNPGSTKSRYFWRKFIRRDFTANCSILSCYSPLIYLFFSGQPFRARELKELKCFCVEDEKTLMSWMMAVRIAKVNHNTTVCLRIKALFPPWQVQIRQSAILRVNFEVIGAVSPYISFCFVFRLFLFYHLPEEITECKFLNSTFWKPVVLNFHSFLSRAQHLQNRWFQLSTSIRHVRYALYVSIGNTQLKKKTCIPVKIY